MKFYRCEHCGNIVIYLKDAGVPVVCCGEEMQELRPGTVDASVEKHVPLVEKDGSRVTVSVGAAEHPMIPEHFIQWILLETSEGIQDVYKRQADFHVRPRPLHGQQLPKGNRTCLLYTSLVADKEKARRKYKNAVVDDATIDDILLLYVKGEQAK